MKSNFCPQTQTHLDSWDAVSPTLLCASRWRWPESGPCWPLWLTQELVEMVRAVLSLDTTAPHSIEVQMSLCGLKGTSFYFSLGGWTLSPGNRRPHASGLPCIVPRSHVSRLAPSGSWGRRAGPPWVPSRGHVWCRVGTGWESAGWAHKWWMDVAGQVARA